MSVGELSEIKFKIFDKTLKHSHSQTHISCSMLDTLLFF